MVNFNLDRNEKNRILEMHKKATKNQYLSEQSFPIGDMIKQGVEMIQDMFNTYKPCMDKYKIMNPGPCIKDSKSQECKTALEDLKKTNKDFAQCISLINIVAK